MIYRIILSRVISMFKPDTAITLENNSDKTVMEDLFIVNFRCVSHKPVST